VWQQATMFFSIMTFVNELIKLKIICDKNRKFISIIHACKYRRSTAHKRIFPTHILTAFTAIASTL
jgi:hypothetical protein